MQKLLERGYRGLFLFLFFLLFSSCTAWKTKKLHTKRTILIKYGKECGEIGVIFKKQKIVEYPTEFFFSDNSFWVADVVNKRVLAFDYLGHPVLCISAKKNDKRDLKEEEKKKGFINKFIIEKKRRVSPKRTYFNFGFVGRIDAYYSDNIVVENRLPIKSNLLDKLKTLESLDESEVNAVLKKLKSISMPSFLIVFGGDGRVKYAIENPFTNLKSFWMMKNGNILVMLSKKGYIKLSEYSSKKEERYVEIYEGEKNEVIGLNLREGKYKGVVENVAFDREGGRLYLSAVFYNGTKFGYKKIYEFDWNTGKVIRNVMNIEDVRKFLYGIFRKKLYIWDTENIENIWLYVYNEFGNLEDRKKITFLGGINNYIPRLFSSPNGDIYTVKYLLEGVLISLWQ
jgi:hypothetical protein